METTDLVALLPLADGTVLITADTVPGTPLAAQLSNLAGGLPIAISKATRTLENNTLKVSGLVSVLGQPDIPVTLSAAVVPSPAMLQLQAIFQLDKVPLPLQTLWQRLGLPNPKPDYVPTNLAISTLTLDADTAGNLNLAATAAPALGWPLDLGPTQLQLTNLKLTVRKPNGASAVSRLGGELKLSEALTLTMDCDTTGSFSLGAQLPATTLRQLVKSVTQQDLPRLAPTDLFDLSFSEGSVVIGREDAGLTFSATGTVGGIRVVLQARRAASAWGFALGLGLPSGAALDPPVLEQVRQLCRLDSLLLVCASYDDNSFSLASLVAPGSPAAGKRLALSGGLQQGLTAYANWQLDGNDSRQKLLRRLMPALPRDLAVLLHLDPTLTGGRMAVGAQFAFNEKSNNPLSFDGALGLEVEAGKVSLFLEGSMQTQLQGRPLLFGVEAEFLPTGALISGSMLGTVSFAPLPVLLSNMALVVGVNAEGVPSLGLAGTLAVQDFQSSVAVFFDSTTPTQSLLAGSVSNLNLLNVLTTFVPTLTPPSDLKAVLKTVELTGTTTVVLQDGTNELANSLKNRQLSRLADALRPQGVQITSNEQKALLVAGSSGNTWFLTDLSVAPPVHYELTKQGSTLTVCVNPQLYCAPQDTRLGRLTFAQGLFINAKLKILSFEALANIKVSLSAGLLVEGRMSRIVVGTEQLFSITAESDASQGAHLSVATYRETHIPTQQEMDAAAAQIQDWTQAQAQAQTQIQAWQLAQIQWQQAMVLRNAAIAVGKRPAALPPAPVQPVLPNLGPRPTMPVPTSVDPHFLIDGKVVMLGLRTGIYASVSERGFAFQIDDTPQRGIYLKLFGSFSGPTDLTAGGTLTVGLDGVTIDLKQLGKVTLDTNVQGTLSLAVATVLSGRSGGGRAPDSYVRSTASFLGTAQALGQSVSLPLLALDVNSPSLLSIQQQLTDLLAPALTKLLSDSQLWLKYVTQGLITGVQDVSQVLTKYYNLKRDKVLAIYQQTSALTDQVGAVLKNTFGVAAPEEAARLLNQAQFTADQAGRSLRTTYGVTKDGISDLLDKGGYALDQINGTLSRVFGVADPIEAGQLLGSVGRTFTTVQLWGGNLIKVPGPPRVTADQLTQAVSAAYALTKNNLVSVLQPVGYPIDDISNVLRNTFRVTDPQEAAALLKTFPIDQLKGTLQNVYKVSNNQLASALKAAGYGIQDIGNLLKNNVKLSYQDVAKALKSAGYGVDDLYKYIKDAFSFKFTELPSLLSFIKGLF